MTASRREKCTLFWGFFYVSRPVLQQLGRVGRTNKRRRRGFKVRIQMKMIMAVLVAAFLLTFTHGAVFARGGGTPNGQPFQAIQGQIGTIEVSIRSLQDQINSMQEQIDALIVDVNSLEERVSINERFIDGLQAENVEIKALLNDLAAQAEANGEQIDTNSADIRALFSQLTANNGKIDYLQDQIDDLNASLAAKQDILDGNCPEGFYLRAIAPDGGITCETDVSGSGGSIETMYVSQGETVPGYDKFCNEWFLGICIGYGYTYHEKEAYAKCPDPDGWTVSAGGFYESSVGIRSKEVVVYRNYPSRNGWSVNVKNYGAPDHDFSASARCIRLAP
jgi:hypothetical protein